MDTRAAAERLLGSEAIHMSRHGYDIEQVCRAYLALVAKVRELHAAENKPRFKAAAPLNDEEYERLGGVIERLRDELFTLAGIEVQDGQ